MDLSARPTLARTYFPRSCASPFDQLTPRELEIAKAIAAGERMVDITVRLGVSPKTSSTHKYRIYDKLGVSSEAALMALAQQFGLAGARPET